MKIYLVKSVEHSQCFLLSFSLKYGCTKITWEDTMQNPFADSHLSPVHGFLETRNAQVILATAFECIESELQTQ